MFVAPTLLACLDAGGTWTEPPALHLVDGGSATVSPDVVEVQTKLTLDYTYTVGVGGLGVGDRVRIEDPLFQGIRWTRWGLPRLAAEHCTPLETGEGPSRSLVTASTDGAASLSVGRSTGQQAIHAYAWTEVTVTEGALQLGDTLTVRFGDTVGGGGCGHQTPDRAFTRVAWRSFVERAGVWAAVEPAPTFDVVARPTPTLLHVAAPSQAVTGQPFRVKVAPLDELGNPTTAWSAEVEVAGSTVVLTPPHAGWVDVEVTAATPGVHRIPATAGGLEGLSNPILVTDEAPEQSLYWGDIHVHHGHSHRDDQGDLVHENHAYARDVMGYDVGCHSVKASAATGPYELEDAAIWEEQQAACRSLDRAPYVALLGLEWMGNGASDGDFGHHNLYFDACDAPLASMAELTRLEGPGGVYAWAEDLEAERGVRTLVVPHASSYTGFDWSTRNDERRTVAEIYSEWGDSLDPAPHENVDPEGAVLAALSSGHRLGFVAASDNHDGWMGNPLVGAHSGGNGAGGAGLTAFRAPALTHADLWEALAERRTYATTGERILLALTATAPDGSTAEPGGSLWATQAELRWSVHGTDALAAVDLVALERGAEASRVLHQARPDAWDLDDGGSWAFDGEHAVWLRVVQEDGGMAWSSPIWVGGLPEVEVTPADGCGSGGAAWLLLPLAFRRRSERR